MTPPRSLLLIVAAAVMPLFIDIAQAQTQAAPGPLPLDADSIAFLQAQPPAPAGELTPAMRKESYRQARLRNQPDLPQVFSSREETFISSTGGDHEIRVRLYRAAGTQATDALPVLIFYHGGGWMLGDLDSHDWLCRSLANAAKCAVVAVDYRLSPEHVFPAAFDDALITADWVAANAERLHLDATRISLGGDSAGGNLAAAVALALREEGSRVKLRAQVLFYPAVDLTLSHPPDPRFDKGLILTNGTMRYLIEQYVPDAAQRRDRRASPLAAPSLAGLPPAFIVEAGCDPLQREVAAYAQRLESEHVSVTIARYPGQMHGFLSNAKWFPSALDAVQKAAEALRKANQ